jgi:hypothetical protein
MVCKVCGKRLRAKQRSFCSNECFAAARGDYLPTPRKIKAECRELRLSWDRQTELDRRVTKPIPLAFPVFSETLFGGER